MRIGGLHISAVVARVLMYRSKSPAIRRLDAKTIVSASPLISAPTSIAGDWSSVTSLGGFQVAVGASRVASQMSQTPSVGARLLENTTMSPSALRLASRLLAPVTLSEGTSIPGGNEPLGAALVVW